jgi:hypothetical protein
MTDRSRFSGRCRDGCAGSAGGKQVSAREDNGFFHGESPILRAKLLEAVNAAKYEAALEAAPLTWALPILNSNLVPEMTFTGAYVHSMIVRQLLRRAFRRHSTCASGQLQRGRRRLLFDKCLIHQAGRQASIPRSALPQRQQRKKISRNRYACFATKLLSGHRAIGASQIVARVEPPVGAAPVIDVSPVPAAVRPHAVVGHSHSRGDGQDLQHDLQHADR